MPTLKQLTCTIEHGSSNQILPEFCTSYGDGFVETYVPVPSKHSTFSIHLVSEGYIASGLAMFVFIDGVAQCNRNRVGLIPSGKDTKRIDTDINFRVRQKEDKTNDGQWIGREWAFQNLNTDLADANKTASDDYMNNVGTIEVIVRRCHTSEHDASFHKPGPWDVPKYNRITPKQTSVAKHSTDAAKSTSKSAARSPVASLGGLFDGAYEPDDDSDSVSFVMMRPISQLDGSWGGENNDAWGGEQSSPRESARSGGIVINQYLGAEGNRRAQGNPLGGFQASVSTPPIAQLRAEGYGQPPQFNQPPTSGAHRSSYGHRSSGQGGQRRFKGPKTWRNDNNWGGNNWDNNDNQDEWNNNWDQNAGGDNPWNVDNGGVWPSNDNDNHDENTDEDGGNNNFNNWDNNAGGDDQNEGDTGRKKWPAWNGNDTSNDKIDAWNAETKSKSASKKSVTKARPNEKSQKDQSKPSSNKTSQLEPKPYWSTWAEKTSTSSKPEGKKPRQSEKVFIAASEVPPQVPKAVAEKANMSHQVKAGKGAKYNHPMGRPEYLDTMEKPYAVFTFKYRSREMLKKTFGTAIKEEKGEWEKRMMTLPKEELVKLLREAKRAAGYSTDSSLESDSDDEDSEKEEDTPTKDSRGSKKENPKSRQQKDWKDSKTEKKEFQTAKANESSKKSGSKGGGQKEWKNFKSEKKPSSNKGDALRGTQKAWRESKINTKSIASVVAPSQPQGGW